MFPLCLINASVTDAGRIRSRLVSFPLTLFSSVCHIAFPMVLFKKQTCSLFIIPTWPPLLFFCFFSPTLFSLSYTFDSRTSNWNVKLPRLCQTADSWFGEGFAPLRSSVSRRTPRVWLIISPLLTWHISLADSIETGYRKWLFFSLSLSASAEAANGKNRFWVDSGACLAGQR